MPRGARGDSRADTAAAVACAVLSLILLILPERPRDTISSTIRGTLVSPVATLQQRASLARRSFLSNDSLVRVADSVVQRSQRLDQLEAENARLRGLLGLGRALRWGFVPAEALVGRGMGDDFTLVLSAGARAGVERLSAVVAPEGLVGVIEQVDATTSVAITWPHPDFRVSAVSADGSTFGMVTSYQGEGPERYLLEMRGVPFRAPLRPNTPIMASGLGGVFPRGILIGTVIQELQATAGWTRTYLLRPAVRPPDLTSVMILSPERNADGVESVWASTIEAMTRRVVGAGDSLARRSRDSTAAAAARAAAARAAAASAATDTTDTTTASRVRRP